MIEVVNEYADNDFMCKVRCYILVIGIKTDLQ